MSHLAGRLARQPIHDQGVQITMPPTITFDPTDADDVEWVQNLLATPEAEEEAPAPPAPKKAAPKKAAAAKVEEEPAEDEGAEEEGATLQQCIDKATELVGEGRAAEVKGALTNLGVKRVGELEESQYQEFLDALGEESVV